MSDVLDVHHNFVQCDMVEDKLKTVQVDYFPRAQTVQRLQPGRGVQVQPLAGRGGE